MMASERDPVTIPATPSVQITQPATGIGRSGQSSGNQPAGDPAAQRTAAAAAGVNAAIGVKAAAGTPAAIASNAAAANGAAANGAAANAARASSAAVAAAAAAASAKSSSTAASKWGGSTGSQVGTQPQTLVNLLNKQLNDSGRPDQFRIAPNSGAALIQQINPATGAVVGEFAASEFPALARSVGVAGALIDGFA
jgi:hypothetical protein